jgi:hypothetical protein
MEEDGEVVSSSEGKTRRMLCGCPGGPRREWGEGTPACVSPVIAWSGGM